MSAKRSEQRVDLTGEALLPVRDGSLSASDPTSEDFKVKVRR
jgi:hypothetical protein